MNYKRLFLILALAVFVSWGCATTRSVSSTHTNNGSKVVGQTTVKSEYADQRVDADISSAIKVKFASDEMLSDSDINVDTNQRNVTLSGNLNTKAEANRAIQLGRDVSGVRSVHSILIVKETGITFR